MEALAPLRHPVFRMLWLAALASNVGEWMQTVGAQWYLLGRPGASFTVPLVQAASSAPFLVLGVPAGVVGEFLNRRAVLIAVQVSELAVGTLLTVVTVRGGLSPVLLLVLTFLLGSAAAVQLPAYQALTPELVDHSQIATAATLSAASVNIGRVVGPAVAGVLIAGAGVPWAFGLNALTAIVFLVVLLSWRSYRPPAPSHERIVSAATAGIRYMEHAPVMRRLLARLVLFLVPANAMWALLPLIAERRLHLSSSGYGVLLGAVGIGSLAGALLLPSARRRLGSNTMIALASAVFGAGLVVVSLVPVLRVVIPALLVMGVGWICVVSGFSGLAQTFLPSWVRARGLSLYQLTFFGSAAVGSALASAVASGAGVTATSAGAGVLVLLVAASQVRWKLVDQSRLGRESAQIDLPEGDDEPAQSYVLVLVRWQPDSSEVDSFLSRMRHLADSRRRTGARSWALYRDHENHDRYHEVFAVHSWAEHLDQHATRLTRYDRQVLDDVEQVCAERPAVSHLILLDPRAKG